jgi:hypothetical protein
MAASTRVFPKRLANSVFVLLGQRRIELQTESLTPLARMDLWRHSFPVLTLGKKDKVLSVVSGQAKAVWPSPLSAQKEKCYRPYGMSA